MISEITKDGYTFINMHMEQVYTEFCRGNSSIDSIIPFRRENNYLRIDNITFETICRLEEYLEKNSGREIILDFKGSLIKAVQNNVGARLKKCIKKEVHVINMSPELRKNMGFYNVESEGKYRDYDSVFEDNRMDYVLTLRENSEYECANGVILSKYINLKTLIEDNCKFFSWCYWLCSKLQNNAYFSKLNRNQSDRPVLLAHTLNSACISTIISKLLGLEMVYIDHLGPHNRITGMNFLENYNPYQNYLVVVDFICQGNEILRAQNIVEFIGGKYKGFIGMIKLDISKINTIQENEELIKETVLNVSSEEAVSKLEYTIKTKVCCDYAIRSRDE